jgi:hypothetical protein
VKDYAKFVGKQLIKAADELNEIAEIHGLTVNILDKTFPNNIDVDFHRLNVMIDGQSVIRKFFIG